MAIKLGSSDIAAAYLGSTSVSAMYLGSTQVWGGGAAVPALGSTGFVHEGDSLTFGATNSDSYPALLSNITSLRTINRATNGGFAADMDTNYATDVAPYYSATNADTLVYMAGTNDIHANGATAAQVIGWYQSIGTKAKATGFKVVFGTITPRADAASGWTGAKNSIIADVNTWIRGSAVAGGYADRVADFAAITQFSDPTDTTYYLPDALHPNDAGNALMAECVRAAVGASLVAAPSGQTWSLTRWHDDSGSPTFSNNDRTVALAGYTNTRSYSTIKGKRVFTVTVSALSGSGSIGIGHTNIVSSAQPALGFTTPSNSSIGLFQDGQVIATSSALGGGLPTFAAGTTVGVVVDETNKRMWWTKDGTTFYGANSTALTLADVEAGTGSRDITNYRVGGGLYAAVGTYGAGAGTFDLLQAWPWTMPSGYSYLG